MALSRIKRFFLLALGLLICAPLMADRLVLQLAHEHDFRAAGFYAAKWQGFYKDVGLDVEIRPAYRLSGDRIDPLQSLNDRQADVAVGESLDILLAASKGAELTLVSPLFSLSSAVFVCAQQDCRFSGKRLKVAATSAYLDLLLHSGLVQRQFGEAPLDIIDLPLTYDALAAGGVDILLTSRLLLPEPDPSFPDYVIQPIAAPFQQQHGAAVYALTELAEQRTSQLVRFRQASIQGWHYAMTHPEAIADAIAQRLPRHRHGQADPIGYNRSIAAQISRFLPDQSEIGFYHSRDWLRMQRQLLEHQLLPQESPQLPYLTAELTAESEHQRLLLLVFAGLLLSVGLLYRKRLFRGLHHLSWLLLIVVAGGAHWYLESFLQNRAEREMRLKIYQQLSVIRADIEGIMINSLSLLSGLSAHIASEPDLSREDFNRFTALIFERGEYNINYAAAPDMVIKFIYPLEGNEQAVGLNYLEHPEQRQDAVFARDKQKMVVTDPISLVQGGTAVIARAPVFYRDAQTGTSRFWGLVSSPIDIESVFHDSGLFNRDELAIGIRSQAVSGKVNKQVVGDGVVFSQQPVLLDLNIGDKVWQLAAIPAKDDWQSLAMIWPVRVASVVILVSMLLMLYLLYRRNQEKLHYLHSLQFRETLLQDVGSIARIGAWEYDCASGLRFWSHALYRIFQLPESASAPSKQQEYSMFAPDVRQTLERAMKKAEEQGEGFDLELPLLRASSESCWVRYIGNPVVVNGQVSSVRGAVQDITQMKQAEQTIIRQANYDALTNLPNRNLFDEQLAHHIVYCERSGEKFVLLFLDLDQFKSVNDSLGHAVGDELLIGVAQRLNSCVRKSDFLSRRSGDEFTLLITQLESYTAAEQIARGLLERLSTPFSIQEKEIHTSASIGLTIYPDDGSSASQLLKNADQAMYAAKEKGRNRFSYFTEKMQQASDQRLQLHTQLIGAIGRDEIEVFYQPIIELESGRICKCEALVRWNHPQQGYISPVEFIPIAEEFGLISKIGQFVMDRACNDIAYLNQQLGCNINLALNKSVREFENGLEAETSWIDSLMGKALFPNITIEITESLLMGGDLSIKSRLEQLQSKGVKIAIDDFGTGYSCLSYLKRFPIDLIKLDRSFVHDIDQDRDAQVLAEAILAMASSLSMDVVAEGVETEMQQQILLNNHCRYVQGYLYSAPLPIAQFRELVEKQMFN